MRERIEDVDTRFCADCCATWYADRCNKQDYSPHPGMCGLDMKAKMAIMKRNRHSGKKWVPEYMARLASAAG
jgi:hypothetical protein